MSDKVSRLQPGQHRLLQDVDTEFADRMRELNPEQAAKQDYRDSLWTQKPRQMRSAGPVESISTRWVASSEFSTEKVAALPSPTIFWGRPSRDGRYFAVQLPAMGFHLIDLSTQGKRRIDLSLGPGNLDPAFTPSRLVSAEHSIPIERLDRLSDGSHSLNEASRDMLGGYADPNSRIVAFSEYESEAMAVGSNPPDHLHSENRLLLAHWDDKKGDTVGGPIFNVPGQWDFTVASDEPAVIGRFGPPDDNFNGPRDKSYKQTGYIIYDVNPETLDIVPRIKINTLRGGKAKLMDNFFSFCPRRRAF